MPDRGIAVPRVVIPRKTQELADLVTDVYNGIENSEFGSSGINPLAPMVEIENVLELLKDNYTTTLNTAITAENTAQIARANLAQYNLEALDELRNARDLILGLYPTDPMQIVNYGFEAYTSPASNGGGGGTEPDPGGDGGDDDPVIIPT